MDWLLPVAFLACPVGMGLMMWFMMKGRGGHGSMASAKGSPEERLASLEAEKRALEQQLASPEQRLARLEAEKRALEQQLRSSGNGKSAESAAGIPEGKKLLGN